MNIEERNKFMINKYFDYLYYEDLSEKTLNKINFDISIIELFINNELNNRERFILFEHHVNKKTLKSIAIELNISHSHCRQILFQAKRKIIDHINTNEN